VTYAPLLVVLGCASLLPSPSPLELQSKEAAGLLLQGKYQEARAIYLRLAGSPDDPALAEESRFKAASILVHHRNPGRSYAQAAREFESFVGAYPDGHHVDEARTWLAAINEFAESRTNKLMQELAAVTVQLETAQKQLQEAQHKLDAVTRERDAVLADKGNLTRKVDELLDDKHALLKEKRVLLADKDDMLRQKSALEKRVAALTKEKESLTQKKEKLERDIQDLKMLDVKMERRRKKVK
jgi:uncharacterized protein YoxC